MDVVVKDRKNVAAWVVIAGVILATIVLGLLNRKAEQST